MRNLPGRPDFLLTDMRIALFVNGCFWHQHEACYRATMPKSNVKYWKAKLVRNQQRFERNRRALRKLGYKTAVIWECQTSNTATLKTLLTRRFRQVRRK